MFLSLVLQKSIRPTLHRRQFRMLPCRQLSAFRCFSQTYLFKCILKYFLQLKQSISFSTPPNIAVTQSFSTSQVSTSKAGDGNFQLPLISTLCVSCHAGTAQHIHSVPSNRPLTYNPLGACLETMPHLRHCFHYPIILASYWHSITAATSCIFFRFKSPSVNFPHTLAVIEHKQAVSLFRSVCRYPD